MDLAPELLDAVRQHLRAYGFETHNADNATDSGADLILTHRATKDPLNLVAKSSLSAIPHLKLPPGPTVVAALSITPSQAAILRAAGAVGVIDAAGNAAIETNDLYIHVEGRPPTDLTRAAHREKSRGWAARTTGLQVLFALLTRPELMEARLVDIARVAGVSTTTAHRVLDDLTWQGLLDGESMGRFWLDRDGAVRAWLEGYTRTVAPRQKESAYISPMMPGDWMGWLSSRNVPVWLTGGAALRSLGADLRPVATTVYLPDALSPRSAGIKMARPRTGEMPNLFVRRAWWPDDAYPPGLAPVLLVHADALASGDPRIVKAAQEVMADAADVPPPVAGR